MTLPPALILAGGQATRLGGGDKCLLELGGRPILAWIVERLAPQCATLALNANGDATRFAGFGLPVLPDSLPGQPGPLAGVLAGMDWAAGLGAGRVVSVSGDTPFLPRDLVARLAAQAQGIVLAGSGDPGGQASDHPTCGLWPVSLREALRGFLADGGRRVRDFARAHGAATAGWTSVPIDPFFNVNSPTDLERARKLARQAGDAARRNDDRGPGAAGGA